MKANTRKAVCSTANALVKLGYSRSEAMRTAWRIVRLPDITAPVKGTASAPLRQKAPPHLPRYSPEDVSFRIAADVNNPYDKNAVAVIAGVRNKGSFLIILIFDRKLYKKLSKSFGISGFAKIFCLQFGRK